jgi:hypothetical protein
MFVDTELSIKEIGKVVPKLSDAGVKSVASHLKFKPAVVKALSDKNLLNVVLEEIDRRSPNEQCTLRSHDDTPVGIPKGTTAVEINEFLDKHAEYLLGIDFPFTKTIYQKKIDTDIEMLQGDVFKLNYSALINTLAGKVEQRIDLMRMFCSNKSYHSDKSFIEKTNIESFDPLFEKFTENRDSIIEKIRRSLNFIVARKANVLDLKTISDTAAILHSKELKDYLTTSRNKVLQAYELPIELPRGFGGGDPDEEDYTLDLFKLPKSWKKTAELADTTVYDLWNELTKSVTKFENLKLLDVDTILKAHIQVAKLLTPVKNSDNLIAKKRTS